MDTVLDLPKSRSRESSVPHKILLVDDDELELSLMSDRLTGAGFQVAVAHNGEEALSLLDKQWFPVVIADWQMPVMDGIELVEKLRERGGEDSYFIMLSVRATNDDFERGYCAGVDDYLSKKSMDTEILARIDAGLNTVALRRSLRQSRAALATAQAKTLHDNSDGKAQLMVRLQSELARAKRYRRPCSLLMLGVGRAMNAQSSPSQSDGVLLNESQLRDLLLAIQGVIRMDVDGAVLFQAGHDQAQFAVVLPETGPAEISIIRSRVRTALTLRLRELFGSVDALDVSVGAASVDPSVERAAELTTDELIIAAENCRRCMASCGARRLAAVQSSVVSQVAIPCRYGYAVADHCLEIDRRYADIHARAGESDPKFPPKESAA